ncbi:MAG TPA: AcvB/VirJ family lysyl-phosphatidylglycerol hydrolase [Thermoanaerobaculia bacterium]|nr:AcvB/VirJ family lysyl-phosphatidylglycerol hydrolase [Thermoanaerobaculia bacterium]
MIFACAATVAAAEAKLPLVEVPSTRGVSDTLVVFVSGDGGWAAIDKSISKVLADNGLSVVGLNALQYFWTKRTPETAAHDLQTICDRYLASWKKGRLLFVGYSRGADVLPAMISRLSPELRQKIRLIALLGPSPTVQFEFHVADWLRSAGTGYAVKPEVDKLRGHSILCLSGEDDKDSLCRELGGRPHINVVTLKGAHHFDGGYEKLGQIILEQLK